jgi:oxidoreductase
METGLHALVIGATGAVGREIVDLLVTNSNWSKITIVVRRKIPRWEQNISKINFIEADSLDFLANEKNELEKIFTDGQIHTLFCCLGSRVGRGKEEFVKVDYTYVINSAFLCQKLSIPHFSLVSSKGANVNSCFFYFRTKGNADRDVVNYIIDYVSIFRPGALFDRDNDKRCMESILKCLRCCIPGISCKALAEVMIDNAEDYHKNGKKKDSQILENSEIVALSKRLK